MKGDNKLHHFKNGAIAAIPIMVGYVPIAMAFGMLSKTTEVSMLHSLFFSLFVFAGASQFMALNMLAVGAGLGEIVLTTLLVNFRHFLMGAALAARTEKDAKKLYPIIAFGVTDEVFSLLSLKEGQLSKEFILGAELAAYSAWVGGTGIGYFLGELLPPVVGNSMGIALYAMFIALLVPAAKKSVNVAILALLSGGINAVLNHFKVLPTGWNMIAAIVAASAFGVYLFKENEEAEALAAHE